MLFVKASRQREGSIKAAVEVDACGVLEVDERAAFVPDHSIRVGLRQLEPAWHRQTTFGRAVLRADSIAAPVCAHEKSRRFLPLELKSTDTLGMFRPETSYRITF
jgi:hypothetical protein